MKLVSDAPARRKVESASLPLLRFDDLSRLGIVKTWTSLNLWIDERGFPPDRIIGRFRTWTRIRVNLQHVPVDLRPSQEPLDPDAAPNEWEGISPDGPPRRRPSRARKAP